jgi:hypothetical protein
MTITIEPGITIGQGITIGDSPYPPPKITHTITPSGNAQVSTAQVKFGTGSYTSNSLGGEMLVTPPGDFAWVSGNFTIEFWYYATDTVGRVNLFDFRPITNANGPYITLQVSPNGAPVGSIGFYTQSAFRITTAVNSMVVGQWRSVALVRLNGIARLYINGVRSGVAYTDNNVYLAPRCLIGGATFPIKGYMDEIRFSNIARYDNNYTPATEPFVTDAYTVFLMNCDGTDGSTIFTDSSV